MFKRGMDNKGQLSVEYLLLLVVIFVVFGAMITYLVGPSIDSANDISDVSAASNAVNSIANAVNLVYANGPGSKRTIQVYIPSGNFILSRNGNTLNGTVNLVNGTKTTTTKLNCQVYTYTQTLGEGYRTFIIQWRPNENYISIQT